MSSKAASSAEQHRVVKASSLKGYYPNQEIRQHMQRMELGDCEIHTVAERYGRRGHISAYDGPLSYPMIIEDCGRRELREQIEKIKAEDPERYEKGVEEAREKLKQLKIKYLTE